MPTASSPHTVHERNPRTDSREAGSTTLGQLLRQARENRGLTLERIADETRIPRRHLEALEHDNLAGTPGGFYQRAEIRAYAQAVGLDPHLALARLEFALKPGDAGETPPVVAGRQKPTTARVFVLTVLGIAIVAAAWFESAGPENTPALQNSAATPSAPGSQSNPVLPVQATPAVVAETSQREPTNPGHATNDTAEAHASVASVTELVVTTQPAGARVTVNGVGWGISPVTIRFLTPGDKQIRVSKEGYVVEERALRVLRGRQQALDIPLVAAP